MFNGYERGNARAVRDYIEANIGFNMYKGGNNMAKSETMQINKEQNHADNIITKEMTLGEVIKKFPSAVEIIQDYGLTCVGCGVAFWEPLGAAAKGHGITDKQLDEMIGKLNEAAKDINMNAAVNITQKAADKVMQIINQKKKEGYGLRLGIVEGGCSGFEYSIVLDDKTNDDDTVVEQKGVKVFVDNKSMEFLRGSLIDYVDTMQGAGFKISNPNAKSGCGCGQSFSA